MRCLICNNVFLFDNGISVFNDVFVFKEKVSNSQMFTFANTISHEISHHWFGNLVTMEWWDDLWLN